MERDVLSLMFWHRPGRCSCLFMKENEDDSRPNIHFGNDGGVARDKLRLRPEDKAQHPGHLG